MRSFARQHPFLLLGITTLALTLSVTQGQPALRGLIPLVKILVMPMYLVWVLLTMLRVALIGPVVGVPGRLDVLFSAAAMLAGLAPYALADYLLARWRRGSRGSVGARSDGVPRT
jgi:hypothetical protein